MSSLRPILCQNQRFEASPVFLTCPFGCNVVASVFLTRVSHTELPNIILQDLSMFSERLKGCWPFRQYGRVSAAPSYATYQSSVGMANVSHTAYAQCLVFIPWTPQISRLRSRLPLSLSRPTCVFVRHYALSARPPLMCLLPLFHCCSSVLLSPRRRKTTEPPDTQQPPEPGQRQQQRARRRRRILWFNASHERDIVPLLDMLASARRRGKETNHNHSSSRNESSGDVDDDDDTPLFDEAWFMEVTPGRPSRFRHPTAQEILAPLGVSPSAGVATAVANAATATREATLDGPSDGAVSSGRQQDAEEGAGAGAWQRTLKQVMFPCTVEKNSARVSGGRVLHS